MRTFGSSLRSSPSLWLFAGLLASLPLTPILIASLLAQDVSVFLNWAAEPEHDSRKKQGVTYLFTLAAILAVTGYYKRFRWSPLKTRKISYTN